MKKESRINWNYVIFLASALVLLMLSILSFQRLRVQKESSGWVNHTYQVKFKLEDAFSTMRDAEAAQRSYLMTRDDEFLERYYLSIGYIPHAFSELNTLVNDNPSQQQNLQLLMDMTRRRLARLQYLIDSGQTLTQQQTNQFLIQGKALTDSIRIHVGSMQEKEDALLVTRTHQKESEEWKASAFVLTFSLISLTIIVFSFVRFKKEAFLRTKSEDNAELLEQKVQERTLEITAINEKLNSQNQELERRNAELRSFTYVASHDLKEPLRKIEIFSDRILQTESSVLSSKAQEQFQRIIASVRRMHVLLDSLFSYAQTERESSIHQTDLNTVAHNALETLQETIEEKAAVVNIGRLPTLRAIPQQMEQLFTNLISNSLKYAKPNVPPVISITAEQKRGNPPDANILQPLWELSFTDNGIGFNEEYRDKIFEIFQRLHAKNEYSGTGIGLAICKKIVENHGGNITAFSRDGEGATFVVTLPEESSRFEV
jgi:signal transduction histidine kinase